MAQKIWGEEYRTTMVCVDSYEKGVPQGRFLNPYMPGERTFTSLLQFLQEFDGTLERMDFPKAFQTTRTFAAAPRLDTGPPGQNTKAGDLATFAIRILFRQNASWQGSVIWLEGKREQSFRSALELVLLMGSALENPQAN